MSLLADNQQAWRARGQRRMCRPCGRGRRGELEHGGDVWGKLGCGSPSHPPLGETHQVWGGADMGKGGGLAEATCLPTSRYFLSFLVHPNINGG